MPITANDIKNTWYEGRNTGDDLISSDLFSVEALDISRPYPALRVIEADCDEQIVRVFDNRRPRQLCEVFRIDDCFADARLAKYEPAHSQAAQVQA